MAIQIQIRRDTTANWASNNPVLAQGEIGLNLDLNLIKIGDGVSSWNSLQYYSNLTDIQSLTANWENTYITVQANSANYDYAYNTIINGGTIGGDLTVVGTISATNVLATSATITKIDISQYELSGFVSTGDLVVEGNISAQGYLSADSMYFDTEAGLADPAQGQIIWDANDQALQYGMNGVQSRISQDMFMRVKATETIVKGQAVRASGASGDGSGNITGALYSANSASGVNEIFFVGLAAEDLSTNDFGFIQTQGKIPNVSVSSVRASDDPEYGLAANQGWAIGTILYVSPFDTGKLTQTKPTAPNVDIAIAIVISENGNSRGLYTRYEHGYHLDEIHDVRYIQPLLDGDLLTWDNTLSAWVNRAETDPIFTTWAQANSANYTSTYTTVNTNSANWDYQGTDIKSLTSNWQDTYTTVNTNSANWDYQGTDIKSLTSNWQDTYTTVNTNSADWYQTLLFNDITAELTISNGNTVSLSALSGGGGTLTNETDPIFNTWAQANSASYASTYTTVNTNSASWSSGGSGSGGLSGISYNRWAFTGSPPISSFSIPGAISQDSEAYRVTIDAVIQDSIKYTIDNVLDTITFTEAPDLSANIVVIEAYATAIIESETDPIFSTWAQANSATYESTFTTVNTNSATWSAGGGGGGGGSTSPDDANLVIGLSLFL